MEKQLNKNRGITLIALIIIIVIVLLIVGGIIGFIFNKSNQKKSSNGIENYTQSNIQENKSDTLAGVYADATSLIDVKMGFTENNEKKELCSVKMPSNYFFEGDFYDEIGEKINDYDESNDTNKFIKGKAMGFYTLEEITEKTSLDKSTCAISNVTLIQNNKKRGDSYIHITVLPDDIEVFKADNKGKVTELGTSKHMAAYTTSKKYATSESDTRGTLEFAYQINDKILLMMIYRGPSVKELGLEQLAKNMYELITVEGEKKSTEKVTIKKSKKIEEQSIEIAKETDLDSFKLSIEDAGIEKEGEVIIPETVKYKNNTYRVDGIGDEVFEECTELESISIPSSVSRIGKRAFYKCRKLNNIQLTNGLITIDKLAFWGCTGLEEVKIPNTVYNLGEKVFYVCSNLKKVELPKNNYKLDFLVETFEGCESLEEIELPNSIKEIHYNTFYNCASLKSITIPKGVKKLGDYSFDKCRSLEKIEWKGETYTDKDEFNEKFSRGKIVIWGD